MGDNGTAVIVTVEMFGAIVIELVSMIFCSYVYQNVIFSIIYE